MIDKTGRIRKNASFRRSVTGERCAKRDSYKRVVTNMKG